MAARTYRFQIDSEIKNITPKKHLGQNFLTDTNIQKKIITACDLHPDETVLEIGPGLGVLTEQIAPKVKKLIAIETDAALGQELVKRFASTNVEIIHADFLKYPVERLPKGLKVIGNLPYYISTPILERVLTNPEHFETLFATLQYELGERLRAKIDTKAYGAFTCFVQYYADIQMLFKIRNTAFKPVPKVHSCFLKFTRHKTSGQVKEDWLFTVIQTAFQQRRKTIVNALSRIKPPHELALTLTALKIDPKSRAENISLDDFIRIANTVGNNEKTKGS